MNLRSFAQLPQVTAFCQAQYEAGVRSPYLLETLAEIHAQAGRLQAADAVRVRPYAPCPPRAVTDRVCFGACTHIPWIAPGPAGDDGGRHPCQILGVPAASAAPRGRRNLEVFARFVR